jgi:hypothetical protein
LDDEDFAIMTNDALWMHNQVIQAAATSLMAGAVGRKK